MKIVCFGDSLTFGSMGYSYIKYLDPKFTVINKGINGDTTVCAYERMKKYIENSKNDDVDVYIVAIGTNDLFLPYLSTISSLWKAQMAPRVINKKCISDDTLFEKEYQKYIELILSHNKIAITIGLPLLQLKGFPYETAQERSRIIKKLATKYNVLFINAAFLQQQSIKNISFSYSWKHKNAIRIFDAIIMLVFSIFKGLVF